MRNRLEEIKEKLAAGEYRLTPQRKLVLEILAEHSDRHLSAEEIYDLIRQKNPDVGLATVYRTLELLADLKIIQSINFGDGRARYEFTGDRHHHHHLICLECGRVEEVDDDLLEKLEQSIEEQHRFKIVDHQVKFYGICELCQEKFVNT